MRSDKNFLGYVMSVKCLVMIKAEPRLTNRVWLSLRDMKLAASLYTVAGRYDFFLFIEADTFDSCTKAVIEEIRLVAGVVDTETLLVMKEDWYVSSAADNASAWVLVKTDPKNTERVYDELNGSSNITAIAMVTGRYDILIRISAPTVHEFSGKLLHLRRMEDIKESETFLVSHYKFSTGTVILQKSKH